MLDSFDLRCIKQANDSATLPGFESSFHNDIGYLLRCGVGDFRNVSHREGGFSKVTILFLLQLHYCVKEFTFFPCEFSKAADPVVGWPDPPRTTESM